MKGRAEGADGTPGAQDADIAARFESLPSEISCTSRPAQSFGKTSRTSGRANAKTTKG